MLGPETAGADQQDKRPYPQAQVAPIL